MNPGMTIMPDASITSASPFCRPGSDRDDLAVFDQTSALVKSPTSGSRLSTVPPADQRPARRHHTEVGPRGVEVGDVGRRRHAAPDRPASRSLVVALHELLEIAGLEQQDAEEHQNAGDHQAVLGAESRNGSAFRISARSTDATVAPMNVARPPDSAAPPSTAAVMLASA
jgi:hypothetical protein